MTNEIQVMGAGQGIIELDTNDMEVLYAGGKYMLYQTKDGQLFELRSGTLYAVTVWGLLMKSFKEEPEFYRNLPNWMGFLQRLQQDSHSVVNKMIAETRGFNESQLADWMKKRNDAELEEINFFGNSVAQYSLSELNSRRGEDDFEEEEEDDE